MSTYFKIKPYYSVIIHSTDEVELRSGVWNPISHFIADDKKTGHLSKMIMALNGQHSMKEIADLSGARRIDVESLVDHLKGINVIDTGEHSAFDYHLNITTPTFQHYHYDAKRQTQKPILLLGDSDLTQEIQQLIQKSMGSIPCNRMDASEWEEALLESEDWLYDPLQLEKMLSLFSHWKDAFIVLVFRQINPILASRVNRLCFELNVPWLHAASDGPFILVGPLFEGKEGPCYDCFEQRISMNLRDSAQYQAYKTAIAKKQVHTRESSGYENVILHYLVSLTTMEILNFYLTSCSFVKNKVHGIYLPSMEVSFSEVLRIASCPTCGCLIKRSEHQLYFESEVLIQGE